MTRAFFLALGLLAASAGPGLAAAGDDLWGGAKAGMSTSQVSALFPNAHKPRAPMKFVATLDPPRLRGQELLRDCSQTFVEAPVCALFFFENDSLFNVTIQAIGVPYDPAIADALAARFRAAVADMGGVVQIPCSELKATTLMGASDSCAWRQGDVRRDFVYGYGMLAAVGRPDPVLISAGFTSPSGAP